jgi:hypothetical protein
MLYLSRSIHLLAIYWSADGWCRRRDDDLDGSIYWACMTLAKVVQALLWVSVILAMLIW